MLTYRQKDLLCTAEGMLYAQGVSYSRWVVDFLIRLTIRRSRYTAVTLQTTAPAPLSIQQTQADFDKANTSYCTMYTAQRTRIRGVIADY